LEESYATEPSSSVTANGYATHSSRNELLSALETEHLQPIVILSTFFFGK
jgi:hypothetical protein